MKSYGKIIGSILGYLIGGSIGLFFGFILGHLFDIGYFKHFIAVMKSNVHTHSQQIFFNNTFKIMGYIAKSDGHVSENEIQTARMIMQQLGLNEALKSQAIQLFSIGKKPDFNLDVALNELRSVCFMQPALLQLFLEIQVQMASADGQFNASKQKTLAYICQRLGISGFNFHGNQQRQSHQYNAYQTKSALSDAYQLLEVDKSASMEEVKKAYRRQMSANHPDKLISKGLPPEMIKIATEKTQRIKAAYDLICESR